MDARHAAALPASTLNQWMEKHGKSQRSDDFAVTLSHVSGGDVEPAVGLTSPPDIPLCLRDVHVTHLPASLLPPSLRPKPTNLSAPAAEWG